MTAGHDVGLSDVRDACEMCGRPVDAHDRDIRFTLPDPVLDLQSSPTADDVWMSHEDPRTSVMMQVRDVGAFVRVLLPVSLSGGFSVTFGVWLGVHLKTSSVRLACGGHRSTPRWNSKVVSRMQSRLEDCWPLQCTRSCGTPTRLRTATRAATPNLREYWRTNGRMT